MTRARRWLCWFIGHKPQADVAQWPVINCMRCDLITFQKWPPTRSGWIERIRARGKENG